MESMGMKMMTLLLLWPSLLLCLCVRPICAEVVGALVMPHGAIALDPSHFKSNDPLAVSDAWAIHNACVESGKLLQGWEPDMILLSTPHGIADLNMFSFYLNSKGYGTASTDNCDCPPCCYNVSTVLEKATTLTLIEKLQELGANVSGMVGYGDAEPFPLRWGEVIPLHSLPRLPTVVLSQPNRRYNDSVQMIPELLTLGTELFALLEPLKEKVAVVISADLAHTHLSSGPYGYSNASEPFDAAVGEWAKTLQSSPLLVTAAGYVNRALSCGYTGLVMLHGLMEAQGLSAWKNQICVNHHPSYYGMMVATFTKTMDQSMQS